MLFNILRYIFTLIFLRLEQSICFIQEKEKKRQKVLKLLENKNVGTRLGNITDNETPSTSTKSKSFKSGKTHITSHISKINLNDIISIYVFYLQSIIP